MSVGPNAVDLTWDQLLPEVAKKAGVGGALGGIIQHGQLSRLQMTKPENVALVTDRVGQRVRLPGYVVPLDFDGSKVTGFLLVPYMGACIHVPPPPPNQIVYVHTKEPIEVDEIFEAVWATGRFEAEPDVDRPRPGRLPDRRRDGGAVRASFLICRHASRAQPNRALSRAERSPCLNRRGCARKPRILLCYPRRWCCPQWWCT